jgi:hypothetical protein
MLAITRIIMGAAMWAVRVVGEVLGLRGEPIRPRDIYRVAYQHAMSEGLGERRAHMWAARRLDLVTRRIV